MQDPIGLCKVSDGIEGLIKLKRTLTVKDINDTYQNIYQDLDKYHDVSDFFLSFVEALFTFRVFGTTWNAEENFKRHLSR